MFSLSKWFKKKKQQNCEPTVNGDELLNVLKELQTLTEVSDKKQYIDNCTQCDAIKQTRLKRVE